MKNPKNILTPSNWINDFGDELFGYALSKTGNASLAEDLVQETFLGALKSLDKFKGESSERTYLFSILKFKIADHYRKASTKNEVSSSSIGDDSYSIVEKFFNTHGEWLPDKGPIHWEVDSSSKIENKELASALKSCLGKLPPKQHQLIVRKLIEEEKTETICKELNISPTNYWVIIHRAKLQLRECLEKNWIKA